MVDQLFFAKALQYYKRREVQEAILRHADHREVSPRYGEGFGKRPDSLSYPQDVLEFAKRKATSFHVSEERWESPLAIKTGASRKELDALRSGWDLVLDIDAVNWELSKLTAWVFIESLKAHGVVSISCKFSGNKGWHIGVPFEAFPSTLWDEQSERDVLTKDLFPELPRAIASYLLDYIGNTDNGLISIDGDQIIFGWNLQKRSSFAGMDSSVHSFSMAQLQEMSGKSRSELLSTYCTLCEKIIDNEEELYRLQCQMPDCLHSEAMRYTREQKELMEYDGHPCPKCKSSMIFSLVSKQVCPHVRQKPRPYQARFKLSEVIQFDTVLIAGRHLYRMPYSLHEKSGLVSVVIAPSAVLSFSKDIADPKVVVCDATFLDTSSTSHDEAVSLVRNAMVWQGKKVQSKQSRMHLEAFDSVGEAIAEEHFPPCMLHILDGLKDGKKRAMFALTNFLTVAGWSPDMIEQRLAEWNKKNPEELREVIIKGHMHNVRQKKERILPPNCKSFYQELGVCKPDEFCSRVRNPAQYAIKHAQLGKAKRGGRKQSVSSA